MAQSSDNNLATVGVDVDVNIPVSTMITLVLGFTIMVVIFFASKKFLS